MEENGCVSELYWCYFRKSCGKLSEKKFSLPPEGEGKAIIPINYLEKQYTGLTEPENKCYII